MTTTTPEAADQTAAGPVDKKMLVQMSLASAGIGVFIAAATFIVTPLAQAANAVHGG